MTRIIPNLPKAKAHWFKRTSTIPDYLEVPMGDGSVVKFFPEIRQPAPVLAEALDRFTTACGYKEPATVGAVIRLKEK